MLRVITHLMMFMLLVVLTSVHANIDKYKGITITVKADPQKVGAIGFSYHDEHGEHRHGRAKATYTGSGFKPGLTYYFGYRKHKLSKGIACGSLVLTTNTTVWLDITNNSCEPLLQ